MLGLLPRGSIAADPPFNRGMRGYRSVPTRYLVLAALVCGLVILLAGAAFFLTI